MEEINIVFKNKERKLTISKKNDSCYINLVNLNANITYRLSDSEIIELTRFLLTFKEDEYERRT